MNQVHTVHARNFDETYTAHIQPNGKSWLGWIPEVPAVKCQEPTKAALLKTLETELQETLEAEWEAWAAQFEADVKAGRLDHLAQKARADLQAGRCPNL